VRLRSIVVGGLACVATLGLTVPASAAIIVNDVGLVDTYTAQITNTAPAINEDVYLSPLVFNGKLDVFCIDPHHNISLGSQNYLFNPAPLLTNSDGSLTGTGTPLTTLEIGEIGGLVKLGLSDIQSKDLLGASAAQGAIWEIEGVNVAPNGADASALSTDMAEDLTWAASNPAAVSAIYDTRDNVQGFAAAPEPATWAMMMLGVGMIGGGLRMARRKNNMAASAA
jgi:PEP-CTERM motif